MSTVRLDTLQPGERFTVAPPSYLAPGGSSDAGVLTVDRPLLSGHVTTTDGRTLHGSMLVIRVVSA